MGVFGVPGGKYSLATGWAKGDAFPSRRVKRVAKSGLWLLQASETGPADLDRQVAEILGQMTPDAAVWAALRDEYDVDLFCGWFMQHWNEGLSISPDTLSALGRAALPSTLIATTAATLNESAREACYEGGAFSSLDSLRLP